MQEIPKYPRLDRTELIVLFLLTGLGFWLRIDHLGELSLYGDEDLTALSVRSILQEGIPSMPSGMGYWRAPLYSYLVAGFAFLFDLNELSIRFPSALFGMATIPLFYLLGRRWIGKWGALFAVTLLSFSSMHILFSRMARMYVVFLFFFVLTLYCFVRAYIEKDHRYRYLAFGFGLVSVTLHELGMVLGLLFILPLLINPSDWRKRTGWAILGIGLVLFYGIYGKLQSIGTSAFSQFTQGATVLQSANSFINFLGLHRFQFYPKFRIVRHLIQNHLLFYLAIILLVMIGGFLLSRRWTFKQRSLLFLISLFALLDLFGLFAVTLFLIVLFASPLDLRKIDRRWIASIIILGGGLFAFWTVYGLTAWRGEEFGPLSTGELIRKVVKEGVYFPAMHIMIFFEAYPVMTLMIMAGSLVWFYRKSIGVSDELETLLHLSFWAPLLILGLTREWVPMRYLFPLYPMYLLIFARMIRSLVLVAKRKFQESGIPPQWGITAFALVVLPTLFGGHGIQQAFAIPQADSKRPVSTGVNSDLPFFPDHRGAALFVKHSLKEVDLVIAMDATQFSYYLGQVDYWLRDWSDARSYAYQLNGQKRDIYTGAEILSDFGAFKRALCSHPGSIWLATSSEVAGTRYKESFVPKQVWEFLAQHRKNRVWVGHDAITEVYRFDALDCIYG